MLTPSPSRGHHERNGIDGKVIVAISNIAWEPSDDEDVARLLNEFGVGAIDVAPAKYFPSPADASLVQVRRVRDWWAKRGIQITGMQALMFGTAGLNLFGPQGIQDAMLAHLEAMSRIGAALGATRLVFGSPKSRDRAGLSDQDAVAVATSFFRKLGDVAAAHGVTICLEPNPRAYGANFMVDSDEAARIVRMVGHSAIRMQFDTGAITINNEDPAVVLASSRSLVAHVHASEPHLAPLGLGKTDHARMSALLSVSLPTHVVCIEMLGSRNEPPLWSIRRALEIATHHYHCVDADRCQGSGSH